MTQNALTFVPLEGDNGTDTSDFVSEETGIESWSGTGCIYIFSIPHLHQTIVVASRPASRPVRFTPREKTPGIHWIGGWVGPRAGLDAVVRKIPSPYRESNLRSSIP
jgi:hypothetical protein